MPTLDGSTSRTIVLLAVVIASSALAWHGTINGEAYVALIGIVLGGVVHASGTRQGSEASQAPPPAE
jgi:hypothetical protein